MIIQVIQGDAAVSVSPRKDGHPYVGHGTASRNEIEESSSTSLKGIENGYRSARVPSGFITSELTKSPLMCIIHVRHSSRCMTVLSSSPVR